MINSIKKHIPQWLILARRKVLLFLKVFTKQNLQRKRMIPILHIHLADHCNLNCKGCDNFSPISPKVFADISVFEKDCARISTLTNGKIGEMQLLGGEPLLHRQTVDFLAIARKYFPTVPIKIVTNGVLLPQQTDEFWKSCVENRIEIVVTKYPISTDYDAIRNLARAKGVAFSFYGNTEFVTKTLQCIPLDLHGKQDATGSFLRCNRANHCVALDNGKLYTCSLIPYIKYFNTRFGKNLTISNNDFLDIYNIKNQDEILDFLCKPMPFCRYCNIKGIINNVEYGISKQEITEWTI
ncbi:hypothetical protein SAMD00024442_21_44 [Candidatus Symbiothrix dinenymphae]|nr:hypothetical protein SAMD00024442_21_44 [Candidatus Symbiothrix dinenymphae]